MMKLRTPWVTTMLLAALSGPVLANESSGPDDAKAPRIEKMMQRMGELHARHMAQLKTRLQLDPSQESAWQQFSTTMQPPGKPPVHPDRTAMEKMTTPERLDQMQAMHAQMDAQMKQRADATRAFYASLKPEQQKVFDQETAKHLGRAWRSPMPGHHLEH